MKNVKIDITKVDIIDAVRLRSEYAGAKTPGEEGVFERVATVAADEELLTGFWKEMCSELSEKFKGLIASYHLSDTALQLTMEVSGSFDDTLAASVESDLFNAVVSGVTARWFRIASPERAAESAGECLALLNSASAKLYHRKRPTRNNL